MKRRLRARIGYSLFLTLFCAAALIACTTAGGPWWTIAGSGVCFFVCDCYFGAAIGQLIGFDDAVYDCRIPLSLVEPMTLVTAGASFTDPDPHGPFGDEYWRDVNEQLRVSQRDIDDHLGGFQL